MFRSRSPTPTYFRPVLPQLSVCGKLGKSETDYCPLGRVTETGDTEPVEHEYNVSVSDAPAVHTSNISAISTISIQYYSHCQHQYQYQIELETNLREA